jgi:hypothetical protein
MTTGIPRRLRNRQHVLRHGFLFGGQVAAGIGGGGANDAALNGNGRVEQIFAPTQRDQIDQVFGDALAEAAAVVPRIDEGMQSDRRYQAELAAGGRAVKLADHALGEVVTLDLSRHRHLGKPRRTAPMSADHAPGHARMRKPRYPGGARLVDRAVALARRMHQRQVARRARCQESPFQRLGHRLGNARRTEPCRCDSPAILNEGRGGICRNNLHIAPVPYTFRR